MNEQALPHNVLPQRRFLLFSCHALGLDFLSMSFLFQLAGVCIYFTVSLVPFKALELLPWAGGIGVDCHKGQPVEILLWQVDGKGGNGMASWLS